MRYFILSAAMALLGMSAVAQERTTDPTPGRQEANKACTVPDMSAVKELDLTEAQLVKIREVHADIERECAVVKDGSGVVDAGIMAKHQERIQAVLTEEQYEEYIALGTAERKVKGTREVKGESRTAH